MKDRADVAIVGGGAAGLAAAIAAAGRGASVSVLERLPRTGKKLLATGGGRCNLLNDRLAAADFTSTDPALVAAVFGRFGVRDLKRFFEGLGLRLSSDGAGRVYPATNQAASVLKVLELEIARLRVRVFAGFEVADVRAAGPGFSVAAADGRSIAARSVVLAGGGRSYPALGSNGSCHGLAASFGHRIVSPVPSAVPLVVKDQMCHFLQGQRLGARVTSRVGSRPAASAEGELLFTPYGLSGTAVLDISESVSIALNREGRSDVAVVVDLVPFMAREELAASLAGRLRAGWAEADLGAGILPEKFGLVLPQLVREAAGPGGKEGLARKIAAGLKAREFPVRGTRGWNEAEFTAGGVDAREVEPATLGSKLRRGLYFAGEVLDVQGGRGGYNLAWAWASGLAAGLAA